MRLRKEAGYKNRDDFAAALGINPLTYKGWETGRTRLKLEDACDIADLLRCSLDELAGREWSPPEYSDERQRSVNCSFSLLNEDGKDTAVDRMRELTEIAGYADTKSHEVQAEGVSA